MMVCRLNRFGKTVRIVRFTVSFANGPFHGVPLHCGHLISFIIPFV